MNEWSLGLPVQTKWFPEFFGISRDKGSAGGRGMIYSIPLNGVGHDKMCWKPAKSMVFSVHGYYRVLTLSNDMSFLWKSSWNSKIMPRVTFFSWTAASGRSLTIENLRKRIIWVLD